jgi:hypothetical protein
MPALTPTAHHAPDGLLAFALAAFTIGALMVCGAAELAPTGRAAPQALVESSQLVTRTGEESEQSHVTARRRLAPRSRPGWGRALSEPQNPRRTSPGTGDLRDDLLALAALQRRWGLPSESYAAGTFGS